jgi:hypothetical protein
MIVKTILSDLQELVKTICQTERIHLIFIHGYLIGIKRRQRRQVYLAKVPCLQLKLL